MWLVLSLQMFALSAMIGIVMLSLAATHAQDAPELRVFDGEFEEDGDAYWSNSVPSGSTSLTKRQPQIQKPIRKRFQSRYGLVVWVSMIPTTMQGKIRSSKVWAGQGLVMNNQYAVRW
ncbi:hypothetical protein FA15DRAFT_730286 [Coprinopsis marcescibilis]|uniref:Uncharacterized protein n=1 Tax=Coprinopsis marcescibilis TaxID=230819 RepID=A0A5C3KDZ3_COPMA|nr:hypothetical protein FA15DRAFT_730286 [Coprinopsis marcescibilis]